MSGPRIGFGVPTMFTSGPVDAAALRAMLRVAESGGLNLIAAGDHLNWYSGTLEATAVLGFLAAETDLDICANVVVLPLRNPYLLAKAAATVAHLARGEFWLGVGVGGEHRSEYDALGIDIADRRGRMEEALAILAALLRGEPVDVDGRWFRSRAAPLDPPARVPLLLGGRGPAALRRAATLGDGWTSAWVRPEQFDRRARELKRRLAEAGRSPEGFRFVAHARVAFGPDAGTAWATAHEHLRRHYGTDETEAFRRHTICGTPDDVAAAVLRYADVGAEQVIITFAGDDDVKDLRRFCDEVMPLLR